MKGLYIFLESFIIFFKLSVAGFRFSGNYKKHFRRNMWSSNWGLGKSWGFYRLNYLRKDHKVYGILDIDFNESWQDKGYYDIHGGPGNAKISRIDLV